MFGLGPTELIIILVIILVVFGGKRLPELARSLGKGIREFNEQKEMIQEEYDEVKGLTEMDFDSGEKSSGSGSTGARNSKGPRKPRPTQSKKEETSGEEEQGAEEEPNGDTSGSAGDSEPEAENT